MSKPTYLFNPFLFIIFFIFGISCQKAIAQENIIAYPQGYFMFPIQPNQAASLSGGFADLRANHFHAGIDIRTGGVESYPVYAAAEGYISKIRVMRGGYGNVVHITHPNGYTTVYAHLKDFNAHIEKYLRQKEYEQQIWEIELSPSPDALPVEKGEIIALSGNTGASGGPHLHFEIRDKAENAINPLKFGFKEVQDSQAPVVEQIFLKTLNADARLNGEFGRISLIPVRISNGNYTIPNTIKAHGMIGLELNAYDKTQTSPFHLGITDVEVKIDGQMSYKLNIEKIPFDISTDINVHMDYEIAKSKGLRIQKCYVADGNRLSIYETNRNKGKIFINDKKTHYISVVVKDKSGNLTSINFSIQGDVPTQNLAKQQTTSGKFSGNISSKIFENTLLIKAKNSQDTTAILQNKGIPTVIPLAYRQGSESTFLYNLSKGIADFIQIGYLSEKIPIQQEILPEKNQFYQEANLNINFEEALYDTLYLKTTLNANRLSINTEKIPLKNFINILWKPSGVIASSKTKAYHTGVAGLKYLGGTWIENKLQFKTKELGDFQIITDTEAPSIRPIKIDSTELRFNITDNLSGIKAFNCFIRNEWILMDYDYKSNTIWSIKPNKSKTLSGILRLEVTDNTDNLAVYEVNIDEYTAAQKAKKERIRTLKQNKNVSKHRKSSTKNSSKKSKRKYH